MRPEIVTLVHVSQCLEIPKGQKSTKRILQPRGEKEKEKERTKTLNKNGIVITNNWFERTIT